VGGDRRLRPRPAFDGERHLRRSRQGSDRRRRRLVGNEVIERRRRADARLRSCGRRAAVWTVHDRVLDPCHGRGERAVVHLVIRRGRALVVISNEVVHSGFLGKNGRYHTFRSVREETPSEASS
jgi:hypothetical protein